jgi:hypothetical protein
MKHFKIIIPALLIAFISCSTEKKQKEDIFTRIEKKEKEINNAISQKTIKLDQVRSLFKLYDKAFMDNPKDTILAKHFMKGGELAMHNNLHKRAISFFDVVETEFSNTSHYPMAVFMKAFVFEEAKDTAMARKYYEHFIKENPNHELVDDAQISIKNLGKSLEEILKEFNQEVQAKGIQRKKNNAEKMDSGF